MKIRVLGSAAGGGFPQWNCNCANCTGVRNRQPNLTPRTQSSIAVSNDSQNWVLINCSPDILTQIQHNACMQTTSGIRGTAICGIVLVDSQIDHATGLILLRESTKKLSIWCTDAVQHDLTSEFPLFTILSSYCGVERTRISPDADFQIPGIENIHFKAIDLFGSGPPYSSYRKNPRPGESIGLLITDKSTDKKVLYAPALPRLDAALLKVMSDADCLLVDGTFWKNDELIQLATSKKTAHDMGHIPLSGPEGLVETLSHLKHPRKILIHINNTNPILNESSNERKILQAAQIEVSYDTQEISV